MEESRGENGAGVRRWYRRPTVLLWVIVIVVVSFGTFSKYGILTRVELEHHKTMLTDSIGGLIHLRDSLNAMNTKLRFDTLEIERIAREKYGMSKSGEQVYTIRKGGE